MKYKEFKAKIKDWGKNYSYKPVIEVDCEYIKLKNNDYIICMIYKSERFVLDLSWASYRHFSDDAKKELFKIVTEFAATPIEEREEEKRFIIPLPNLFTTDGRQQYLTYKDYNFFASRRNETLRQVWKEKHLKNIPEIYRQFAVEFDEEKEI